MADLLALRRGVPGAQHAGALLLRSLPRGSMEEAEAMTLFAACRYGYHDWCNYIDADGNTCECRCEHKKVKGK